MRTTLALSLLAAIVCAPSVHADEVLLDGIAAQVGPDIVLVSEVMELASPQERALRAQNAPPHQIMQIRGDALETVIEWRLIEQMVEQTELYATEAEIDTTIEAIAKENSLTLDQLKRSVVAQNMSWESYRAEIKRELERRKILNAIIASSITVEDSEIEALYTERFADQPDSGSSVHVRQILTVGGQSENGPSVEDACDVVRRARESIASGRDFAEFATRFSVVAPDRGGDLGWLHTDQLASYLREMIAGLEPGQLSEVHQLPIGCTLVQLIERKEFRPVSFEEAEPNLRAEIFETKMLEEYRTWMEDLRENTFIERRGYFADAAKFTAETPSNSEFEAGMSDVNLFGSGAAEDTATP